MEPSMRHHAHGLSFRIEPGPVGGWHLWVYRDLDGAVIDRVAAEPPSDEKDFLESCESWLRSRIGATPAPAVCCTACSSELEPVYPGASRYQFDNALWIRFSGGYGMFIDDVADYGETDAPPRDRPVVLCHGCAHELCDRVGWIDALLDPRHSHSHREDQVDTLEAAGHDGWDLRPRL